MYSDNIVMVINKDPANETDSQCNTACEIIHTVTASRVLFKF